LKGQPCLVIQDDNGPYSRNYCQHCALPILKQCAQDLRHVRDLLYPKMAAEMAADAPPVADVPSRRQAPREGGRAIEHVLRPPAPVALWETAAESRPPARKTTAVRRPGSAAA